MSESSSTAKIVAATVSELRDAIDEFNSSRQHPRKLDWLRLKVRAATSRDKRYRYQDADVRLLKSGVPVVSFPSFVLNQMQEQALFGFRSLVGVRTEMVRSNPIGLEEGLELLESRTDKIGDTAKHWIDWGTSPSDCLILIWNPVLGETFQSRAEVIDHANGSVFIHIPTKFVTDVGQVAVESLRTAINSPAFSQPCRVMPDEWEKP
jgi:hypothetical protein